MLAVRSPTPPEVPGAAAGADLGEFRFWKPEVQERALELLKQRQETPWRPFFCPDRTCNGHPHVLPKKEQPCEAVNGHPWIETPTGWVCEACGVPGKALDEWQWEHARADQRPPRWQEDWLTLFMSGGRGSGKTRTGAELTHKASEITPRIILVAPTGPDLRETMVEGLSGLQATANPDKAPTWEPSKKKLTWPNGCIALGFSAEEPDRLRGPQSGFIWADEPAYYPDTAKVWDNMQFGLRVKNKRGLAPKIIATTTPKPTKWMKETLADPLTVVHRVSTYANLQNLAETFKRTILSRYEGTRLGKQELHGELLEDVEGALWQWDYFQWTDVAPALKRVVVSVDPAGSANKRSDETGIIVIGIGYDDKMYVLADRSGKFSPSKWADTAVAAYEEFSADVIVAEKNYGGDMVKHTLKNSRVGKALLTNVQLVDSRRGKEIRAEPIVALYEKHKIIHVGERGDLSGLEGEQTEWVPGEGASPNRVDALVHGATALARVSMPSAVSDPTTLGRDLHAPVSRHLRAV